MEKISKPLNQWNDAELRAEFSKTYFKPLYHPTEQSEIIANDEDFARDEEILIILESRGYNREMIIQEELRKKMPWLFGR